MKLLFLIIAISSIGFANEAPPLPACQSTQNYMMIDPKARALDYIQAFEMLRKEKTSSKVFFEIVNGSTIGNIIEILLMGNGTLLYVKYNTQQGIKFQVISVEEIKQLGYL
jgi:hypothetical protein